MADEVVAPVETPVEIVEPKTFGTMNPEERTAHVASLREKVLPATQPEPEIADDDQTIVTPEARERDDKGRYKKQPASGDETPVADDAGSKAAGLEAEEVQDWRDAEVQDLAAAFGISEARLAKIPSREVLDVLLESIDEKGFADHKVGASKSGEHQQDQQAGSAAQKATDDALAQLEALNLGDELGADDAPKLTEAFKTVTAELKELRAWRVQQEQSSLAQTRGILESRSLDALHKLGHDDLYGKPGEAPTKEQQARIDEVLQDSFERGAMLERRGGKPQPTPEFLKRSVFALHGEHIIDKNKQEQLARAKAQSARRTGGGSTKTLPPSAGANPMQRNLARLPALLRELGVKD